MCLGERERDETLSEKVVSRVLEKNRGQGGE